MMGRIILSLLMAASCVLASYAAPVSYLSCGFESGMPDDFILHDADGATLHFTMVQLGFADTDSWTVLREGGTENHYAASASRFKTSKGEESPAAEDWMVTSPVWIRSADARLSWRGMSVNERNSATSSYKVMVSAEGDSPSDFSSEPVAVVVDETLGSWSGHSVDLGDYVGKRIHIAFVNISEGSDVLAIDDISVEGSSGVASLDIFPGEYTLGEEEVAFGGTITATSDEQVNTLSVAFDVGGRVIEASYADLRLDKGESFQFTLPETVKAEYGETVAFNVMSEVNGVRFDDMERSTTLLAFLPERKVVVEEATGMWCGYCPEGIVAMETLQERYPDRFVGIAVHVDDALMVRGYGNVMPFPSGAPTAWIDRKIYCESPLTPVTVDGIHTYTTLKGGLESLFLDRLAEQALADVDVTVVSPDGGSGKIGVDVECRFAMRFKDADFRLVLMMTEDHVWADDYYQTNYHGGRDEVIGGFESLPVMITGNFEFNHVARSVWGGWQGIEGSLPGDICPAEAYVYSVDWELPEGVNPVNTSIVAMIVDASTGEVMNASKAAVGGSGVTYVDADRRIAIRHGSDFVEARGDGFVRLSVCDAAGMPVARAAGDGYASAGGLAPGIYVVRASCGDSVEVVKIHAGR